MSAGLNNLKNYYNIVYDQAISPSGSHLLACDSYGQLSTFNFSSALVSQPEKNDRVASRIVHGHKGAIYCLQNAEDLLISGGDDGVKIWKWDHLLDLSKDVKPLASFQLPVSKLGMPETNGIAYDSQTKTLYCGCGDSLVHALDATTAQLKTSFSGHSDYVHCVCMRTGSSQLLSGSEDGTVRIWDPAVPDAHVQTLNPAKCTRGEWVGCIAVDNSGDWVVCGGSMTPTFYHLSSPSSATLTSTVQLPPNTTTHTAIFLNDRIITAGSGAEVRHWSINGEVLATVPSSLGHVFSLAYNTKSKRNQVLTVAGDSANIDVFTNFGYAAFSLNVSPLAPPTQTTPQT